MSTLLLVGSLKSACSSRAAWVFACIAAIGLLSASAFAQGDKWEPPVPADLFKDGKTEGKNPQPTHRLSATGCDDCQKIVDELQTALDDWYAMQLDEAKNIKIDHSDMSEEGSKKQRAKQKQIDDAMAGLGQPNAKDLKAKQEKQKKDAKDKKDTHGSKEALAKEIKRLSEALKDCLKKCEPTPTPTATSTPSDYVTPTPTETPTPKPLPPSIKIPEVKPCFDTQRQKDAKIAEIDELRTKANMRLILDRKNQDEDQIAQDRANIDALDAALQKANNAPVCPTPTPTPASHTGGGGGTKKTPTPPGKPKKGPGRTATGGSISYGGGPIEDFCLLMADNKIGIDITGTGETIGHVADARITNFTDEPIAFSIPPGVLESRSGKNQDYGHLHTIDVVLQPHESKKIPIDGICLDRHKPPVGEGVGGDLAFNDCDPDPRISQHDADRMVEISESVDEATDELEDDGQLTEMPYKDPEKRKDIVKQWATWVRMSEITGDPPPKKDDLKKVVEKQVGKVPPDQQKKIDQGIDTIFEKIELATKKAKDLEQEDESENEGAGTPGANTYEISDNTPTPQPGTQEKKKKEGKKKKDKKKKYPPEIQNWLDLYDTWIELASTRNMAEYKYITELRKWALEHSKHYKELNDAVQKAEQKIKDAFKNGKPTQEDWDNLKKAQEELGKNEKEVGKDFQKTESGKALYKEFIDAEDIANKAKARADEAGKNIDEDIKKGILEKERD